MAKPNDGAIVIENQPLAAISKDLQDMHDKSAWYEKVTRIENVEQISKHEILIRPFEESDLPHVKDIFLRANKSLTGPIALSGRFDDYLQAAIRNELSRIVEFYGERQGGFWVALVGSQVVGLIGLAPMVSSNAIELRRMCVDPDFHRQGIGREILEFAFAETLRRGFREIELSTTEFHTGALALYEQAGFRVVREHLIESVDRVVRTLYLSKSLDQNAQG